MDFEMKTEVGNEEEILDAETICAICYAEFLYPEDLNQHIDQVHKPVESYKRFCHFCSTGYKDSLEYAHHIIDEHLPSIMCCRYCTKMFINYEQHRAHEKKHHQKKSSYLCSQCPVKFSNVIDLEKHEIENHDNNQDGAFLGECLPQLSSMLNYKAVTFFQMLGISTNYDCIKCQLTSVDLNEYLNHLKVKKCKSYVCNTCCNVYKKKSSLQHHLIQYKNCRFYTQSILKKCSNCQEKVLILDLKDHEKNCKQCICSLCNITFKSMDDLTEHRSQEHPTLIQLKTCNFCKREYVGENALQKHVERTHKDYFERNKYKCVYCDSVFQHPKKLFGHFFSSHKDLEPYTCKICDQKFKYRKKFTIHIKLKHNSAGHVQFDKNYHVYFTSDNPEKQSGDQVPNESKEQSQEKENDDQNNTKVSEDNQSNKGNDNDRDLSQIQDNDRDLSQTEDNDRDLSQVEDNDRDLSQMEDNDRDLSQMEDNDRDLSQTEDNADKTNDMSKDTEKNNNGSKIEIDVNSDFMNPTEIEGTQTDTKIAPKKRRLKHKINSQRWKKAKLDVVTVNSDGSSEDEPLLAVKKRVKSFKSSKLRNMNRRRLMKNRNTFICSICNKNCYTFEKYHNHISLHKKNELKKCIKCFKVFKSAKQLNEHLASDHSSSKLTETLKKLLEKRKKTDGKRELTMTEKFQNTIKKVKLDPVLNTPQVQIKQVEKKGLSVQKFIENFTPEQIENKKEILVNSSLTIKPVNNIVREPLIKMTRFRPEPIRNTVRLAMPVKFQSVVEKVNVNIKLVQKPRSEKMHIRFEDNNASPDLSQDFTDHFDDEDPNECIPEVAHEVMLGETEECPKLTEFNTKFTISNISNPYKELQIAHLLPEAPYYKIVKVKDVLKQNSEEGKEETVEPDSGGTVKLPDGTKLVTVNPLAHLLGDVSIDKVLDTGKKKYYKPKPKNFQQAVAKALYNKPIKTTPKKKKNQVVE